jgi:hypothetical protein
MFHMLTILADITDPKNISEVTAGFVAFFVQFLPLLLVPFLFKVAGGLAGRLQQFLAGYGAKAAAGIKGSEHDPDSLGNVTKRNFRGAKIRSQAQQFRSALGDYDKAQQAGNPRAAWQAKRRAKLAGRGNILAKEAALNKEGGDRLNATKNFGDDTILNARMAVPDENGVLRTLDGKKVTDLEQSIAKQYYGTMGDMQAISTYRETKDLSNEDAQNYIKRFGQFAQQEGWTPEETMSQWMGTAFARQDERGELKHGSWKHDPSTGAYSFTAAGADGSFYKDPGPTADPKSGEKKADSFINDTYYKKGSFKGANMLSSHPRALLNAKKEYVQRLNTLPKGSNAHTNAEARLRQILEIEEAFKSPMLNSPEEIAKGGPQYVDRMAGASPATIAAFNELTEYNKETDYKKAAANAAAAAAGKPVSGPTTYAHPNDPNDHIYRIQQQIKSGKPMGHENIREQQRAANEAAVASGTAKPYNYVP